MPRDENSPERRVRTVRDDDGRLERVVLEPARPPLAPAWAEVDAAERRSPDATRPRVPAPEPKAPPVRVPRAPAGTGARAFPADDRDATPLAPAWGGEARPGDREEREEDLETAPTPEPGTAGSRLAPAWEGHEAPAPERLDATRPRVPTLSDRTLDEDAPAPLAPAWAGWSAPTQRRLEGPPRVPEHRPGFVVLSHSIKGTDAEEDLQVETHVTVPRARDHARPRPTISPDDGSGASPLAPAWAEALDVEPPAAPAEPVETREEEPDAPEPPEPELETDVQVVEVEEPTPEELPEEPSLRVVRLPRDLPGAVDRIVEEHHAPPEPPAEADDEAPEVQPTRVEPAPDLPRRHPVHRRIDDVVERHVARLREAAEAPEDGPTGTPAPPTEPPAPTSEPDTEAPSVQVDPAPPLPQRLQVADQVDAALARHGKRDAPASTPTVGRAPELPEPDEVSQRVDDLLAARDDL